jgi:hypothetical protein
MSSCGAGLWGALYFIMPVYGTITMNNNVSNASTERESEENRHQNVPPRIFENNKMTNLVLEIIHSSVQTRLYRLCPLSK